MTSENFGQVVRRERERKQITLRKFAGLIGKTPTYVSKIERDELGPPSEATIKSICRVLEQNEDEMLALAGKIPSDLVPIIRRQPVEMPLFLRTASQLSAEELRDLTNLIKENLEKKG